MEMRDIVRKCAIIVLTLSLTAGLALAQAGRGLARMGGVVQDKAGKPIAGAKIAALFEKEEVSNFGATTDKDGKWGIIGVGTGNWMVTITAKGYMPQSINYYVHQLQNNPPLNVKLEKAAQASGIVQDESSFQSLEQGNQFYRDGKYDTALTMYQEFLSKNPGAYEVILNIGDCFREKGDYDKAIENYNKLVELAKPDSTMGKTIGAKGLAAIGLCYLKQGKLPEAQDYFKKSIEMAPQDETLPYNVAEIYFSNQQVDDAIRYYEMAIQIKADWPDPYYRLAMVFLNKSDMAKAGENLEKFLKLESEGERAAQAKAILGTIKK
jgi:tetratricopeptide (TPR) repeat protein